MIILVYSFIVIVYFRSNRRLRITVTVSFHKFWCVSTTAPSVTVFLFSYGPCTHSNQIRVSEI